MIVRRRPVESQSMEEASIQPSVIEPLGPAVERVKTLLFRPFEIERWLAIALCAWLALLGTGGGSAGKGISYNREKGVTWNNMAIDITRAKEFAIENLAWLIPVTLFVLIVVFGLWSVLTWLSSRGDSCSCTAWLPTAPRYKSPGPSIEPMPTASLSSDFRWGSSLWS